MNKAILSIVSFLFIVQVSLAQVTFDVTKYQKSTSKKDIYITGNFEGWTGGKENSPSFWFTNKVIDFTKVQSKRATVRAYFLMGNEEGKSTIKAMNNVIETMKKSGFKPKNLAKKIVDGGKHNEVLWRNGFKEAILWLFK